MTLKILRQNQINKNQNFNNNLARQELYIGQIYR